MSWDRLCSKKSCGGIGFHKLHDFNLALIGKQAWRFITKPELLVSRIYKACYFPNCDFLEESIGSNPSYSWRSIFASQDLIRSGAMR